MPKTYVEQQSMLNATQPKGANYYWKTEFLPELNDGYLESVPSQCRAGIESPMSQVIMFHIAERGERARRGRRSCRQPGRRICHRSRRSLAPTDPERGGIHQHWARSSWERIRPFSTGGNYINFQTTDDDVSRIESSYRGNYERLRRVKAEYDPDNLFRVNRNLEPA